MSIRYSKSHLHIRGCNNNSLTQVDYTPWLKPLQLLFFHPEMS